MNKKGAKKPDPIRQLAHTLDPKSRRQDQQRKEPQ